MAEKGEVYVLDEPTTGLHLADVEQLLGLLDRLVDSGKSVIVIEHHQAVMAHADWIIDLGPGAGHDGGRIVFEGTPADLVAGTRDAHRRAPGAVRRALGVSLMCAVAGSKTMAPMTLTLPLLAASAVALLAPAAAQAATTSYEGDTLVYRADPGVRDSPMLGKGDEGELLFYEDDLTLARLRAGGPGYPAHCPMPARVRLELGDGDDWNSFSSTTRRTLPVEVYGGDGKDQLQTYGAGARQARRRRRATTSLKGWQADDTLIGGPGDDEINGSGGDDHIEGGDGNDSISPDTYYDPAQRLRRRRRRHRHRRRLVDPVQRLPPADLGEHGRRRQRRPPRARPTTSSTSRRSTRTSPARCSGGAGDDELPRLGQPRRGQLDAARQRRQRQADGRRLPGHARRRARQRRASTAASATTCSPAARARTRSSATPPARSCGWYSYTCKIPFGNDVVNARDGEADTIDCGVGQDRAIVDAIDVVANCETVEVAGAAPGPGGAAPAAPASPAPTFAYKLKGTQAQR